MIVRRFVIYSLILHLLAMTILFIHPARKELKVSPFFAKLISPEETGYSSRKIMIPQALPAPKLPSVPSSRIKPSPQSNEKSPPKSFLDKGSTESPSVEKSENENAQVPLTGKEQLNSITSGPAVAVPYKKRFSAIDSAKDAAKDIAQKKEEQTAKSSITFDVKEYKYYGYMRRLKEKIESIWQYPHEEAAQGIYGDLYIRFTIKKNGSLGSVELLRTSGHRRLDDAAMRALREGAPFWPLPDEWKEESFTIDGHFIYTIHGTYLR